MRVVHLLRGAPSVVVLVAFVAGATPVQDAARGPNDAGGPALEKPRLARSVVYTLLDDSVFAEGCKGGGPYGCMCPLRAASEFAGTMTLTLDPRTPPGVQAFNISVQDWFVVMNGAELPVTGTGRYVTWTDLHGASGQAMWLDLLIDGEVVSFTSGIVAEPADLGAFPDAINLALDDGAACYGYALFLAAQR